MAAWGRMDKKKLKEKNWDLKRKVILEADLFYSDAFRSLPKAAMLVLMRFYQKRRWDRKTKKHIIESLSFPYPEAAALGISESTFKRSIRELVEKGLMKITHQGGEFGGGKDYSRYDFSDQWRLYDTPDFPKNLKKSPRISNGVLEKYNKRAKPK